MVLKIFTYIVRVLLAYVYIPHGLEKLYKRINVQEYIDYQLGKDFIDFYLIWERTGFIYLIGMVQLLGGCLLIFKRTCLLGAIVLLPMSTGMLFTHICITHATDFLIFDAVVMLLNIYLVGLHYRDLKQLLLRPQRGLI